MIVFQIDDSGNHRLVVRGERGDVKYKGNWVKYEHISVLTLSGHTYIAATQYYDGVLPTETVLRIVTDPIGRSELVSGVRPE